MRRYNSSRKVPPAPAPLKIVTPSTSIGDLPVWSDGQVLHDLKDASAILTGLLGKGFSYTELRRAIKNEWRERVHYWRIGGVYKVNIRRILDHLS